jgi:hypothetical protein
VPRIFPRTKLVQLTSYSGVLIQNLSPFLSFYPLLFLASCHFGYLGSGCSTSTTLITGCTGKYCCFNRKAPFPSYCNPCCSHFLCSPKKGRKSFGLDRGSKSCELWPSGQVEIESTTCNARPLSLLSDPGPCAPKGGVPPSSAQQKEFVTSSNGGGSS